MNEIENLKWLWNQAYTSDQKAKILEGVVARADSETLKWFWGQSYTSNQKDILLTAMTKMNSPTPKGGAGASGKEPDVRGQFKYDIFISHASEDKADFVRPLAAELNKRGLRVWYANLHYHLATACVGLSIMALRVQDMV